MSVERDRTRGWIVVRASGIIDIDDALHLIQTARASVNDRMIPMLVDAREAHGALSDQEIQRAVAAVDRATRLGGARGHVAIAASDDAVYAGMLRYESGCAEIGVRVIRVFRLLADAEHWLEIVSAARDLR
jgi:hypothetical protein